MDADSEILATVLNEFGVVLTSETDSHEGDEALDLTELSLLKAVVAPAPVVMS